MIPSADAILLVFDECNRLAVLPQDGRYGLPPAGMITTPPRRLTPKGNIVVARVTASLPTHSAQVVFLTIEQLEHAPLTPALQEALRELDPSLAQVPYLHLGENDFIYRFRPEKERNRQIYAQDPAASRLYQSQLCEALKLIARRQERAASEPVTLDFGAVRYILPSHFGFCLGVKNAIERAYETLAENPGQRIFMLSELIHNPFVNADLLQRGLRYLQTEKGKPYTTDGQVARGVAGERLLWDTLTPEDVVIIPAFGATDDDKRRLVRKGIAVCRYDATCMLVEKVWKAARAYGREGFTVVIHGKHEHEETKATFSNTRHYAPAVIVRNLEEARALGAIIASDNPTTKAEFYARFAGRFTPGFDVNHDLEHIAVVNQTTLLMNETMGIIELLRQVYQAKFGEAERVGGKQRRDTLCYATQVNQDALARALQEPLDAALVIGGKNSSNTYQLYRLCAARLEHQAHFIQSERCLHSPTAVDHYVFPHAPGLIGHTESRALWGARPPDEPVRILITGGASCPDGVIQQAIVRINRFFPEGRLRPMAHVLHDLENQPDQPA